MVGVAGFEPIDKYYHPISIYNTSNINCSGFIVINAYKKALFSMA